MWRLGQRGLFQPGRYLLHPMAKPAVFTLALLPLGWLLWRTLTGQWGANPAEALLRASGDWSLRLLCLALAVTPLRVVLVLPALARFRRMLGLYAYFYVSLHALAYVSFDLGWVWLDALADAARRPFILVGLLAWLVLTALAATSHTRMVRLLGQARWKRLHQGVYGVACLALLHFFWMRAGKNDFAEVWVYAVLIALLLGWRAWHFLTKSASRPIRTSASRY